LEDKKDHYPKSDRFSDLMFGWGSGHVHENEQNHHWQDQEAFEGIDELGSDHHHGTQEDWLFGKRPDHVQRDQHSANGNKMDLGNVNWAELMEHADTLMKTANELKPLYKKISPFIQNFIKKE